MNLHFTAERIRDLRRRLGLTQTELASEVGVTQPAVAQWESAQHEPSRPAVLQALIHLEQGDGKEA